MRGEPVTPVITSLAYPPVSECYVAHTEPRTMRFMMASAWFDVWRELGCTNCLVRGNLALAVSMPTYAIRTCRRGGVGFELDEGILKELEESLGVYGDIDGCGKGLWLQNDDGLADIIKLVVSRSRKFRSVLVKMASEK